MLTMTPYHLLVALCIALELKEMGSKIDLAVDPLFTGAHDLSCNVAETGLFDNVVCENRYPLTNRYTTRRILNERNNRFESAYARFNEAFPSISNNDYEVIMTSYPYLKTFDAKEVVGKKAKTWFVDDGSGSRNGNVFTPMCCLEDVFGSSKVEMGLRKKFKSFLKPALRKPFTKYLNLSIEGIALFCPSEKDIDLYQNISVANIPIPKDISLLQKILAPSLDLAMFKNKRVFFLTLPSNVNPKLLDEEATLVHKFHEILGNKLAVRPHPRRDAEDLRLDGLPLTSAQDSWEIIVMSGLIDSTSVLISYASTAQMVPKMLTGAEPNVMFLAKILPRNGADYKASDALYSMTKERYTNKEKVCLPKSFEEIEAFLVKAGINIDSKTNRD